MDNIRNSSLRVGNFTSSQIADLTTQPTPAAKNKGEIFGKPALSYIATRNMERRLGRSLSDDVDSRTQSWGKLCEKRVFNIIDISYRECSTETINHPDRDYWSGNPDAQKFDTGGTIVDIKCPKTLLSFCQLVDSDNIDALRQNHKEGETYYWQLVSNAILLNCKYAELIVYAPYLSELQAIRDLAQQVDGAELHKYYWIANASDNELPYLLDGGHYKNLNVIRFEVPQKDKDFLTACVYQASKKLIKITKTAALQPA